MDTRHITSAGPTGRLRAFLVLWHRWFGLLAALWLTLMGITGSVIVFYEELDSLLNPELRLEVDGSPRLPVDKLVAAAESYKPGSYVSFINTPDTPEKPIWLSLRALPDSGAQIPRGAYVLVNPYTAEVLTERVFGGLPTGQNGMMDFMYQLHIDLKMGDYMVWFLGLVSFVWLLDHFAAAILSFPVAAKWAKSFKIRRKAGGHKLIFDLHRAGGLWFFPVTFILALSGTYLNLHTPFVAVVDIFSEVTHRYNADAPYLETPNYTPKIGYSTAIKASSEQAGGKDIDMVTYYPWQGFYLTRAYDKRDIDPYGRRLISIDATTGAVLHDHHAASGTAGDIVTVWQYPLHSGKAFGWTGRLIIFASGILVTVFSVTGILLWWRKRKARRFRHTSRSKTALPA